MRTYWCLLTYAVAHSKPPLGIELTLFDPASTPPPSYILIARVDAFLDAGITKDNFKALFVQCEKCHTILLCRNTKYHDCMKALALDQEVCSVDDDKEYLLYGIESNGLSMD